MGAEAAFQYLGSGLPTAAFDGWGLWTAVPSAGPGSIAFGPSTTPSVWRVSLSSDPAQARAQIRAGEEQMEALARTVPAAFARFAENLPHWAAALPPGVNARAPEERLLVLLAAAGDSAPVPAFGLGELVPFGSFEQVTRPFRDALEWLRRTLLHYAWVETVIEGRLVARTVVGWSGGFSTCWCEGLDESAVDLHRRSLGLAMGSRNAILGVLAQTTQAALKISALLALPGGGFLALPVAWRLVRRFLG